MKYMFHILRFNPQEDAAPHFQEYYYVADPQRSVLEALMEIRNEQDCDLSFRYSCREAICGSCAMVINGRFELACRTSLESLDSPEIVVEPLPNLEVQKDLVVDMEPFWDALTKVQPFLFPPDTLPEREFPVEERQMERIDQFVACIMCACCYSACPVIARDARYPGPAALAKLSRFVQDPRDRRPVTQWTALNKEGGLWSCDTVFKCNEVCPKSVRPADGIEALRRKMLVHKIKHLFRRAT